MFIEEIIELSQKLEENRAKQKQIETELRKQYNELDDKREKLFSELSKIIYNNIIEKIKDEDIIYIRKTPCTLSEIKNYKNGKYEYRDCTGKYLKLHKPSSIRRIKDHHGSGCNFTNDELVMTTFFPESSCITCLITYHIKKELLNDFLNNKFSLNNFNIIKKEKSNILSNEFSSNEDFYLT